MLRKQLVPIQFGELDEKTESKALPPGSMTTVKNAERNKTGRYDKREGYGSALSTSYLTSTGSATASSIDAVGAAGKSIFGLNFSSSGAKEFLGWGETAQKWHEKNDYTPCSVKTDLISANADSDVSEVSCASDASYTITAYSSYNDPQWDTGASESWFIRAVVTDNATGHVVATHFGYETAKPCVQAVIFNSKYYIFYKSSSTVITAYEWDGTETDFDSGTNIVTGTNASYPEFMVANWT